MQSDGADPMTPNNASTRSGTDDTGNLTLLRDVGLDVSIRFGSRKVSLGVILGLEADSVLALDQGIDEPVDLLVGGKLVGRGEVVTAAGRYALRLTEVVGPQQVNKKGVL